MELIIGTEYKRSDLHDYYGGQRQGGCSTPQKYELIFLFSNESGLAHGYKDGLGEDGYYRYTGHGQVGDMEFKSANKYIRDHEEMGKEIYLFLSAKKSIVRLYGKMRCVDYDIIRTHDTNNKPRNAIQFILEKIGDSDEEMAVHEDASQYGKKRLVTESSGLITNRVGQYAYRKKLLDKFNRKCAVTGLELQEILIASHIKPWKEATDEERLDVDNGILLSPNYDALFDKGLISFSDEGNILVSNLLTEEIILLSGIDTDASICVTEGMIPYLHWHQEYLRK